MVVVAAVVMGGVKQLCGCGQGQSDVRWCHKVLTCRDSWLFSQVATEKTKITSSNFEINCLCFLFLCKFYDSTCQNPMNGVTVARDISHIAESFSFVT